MIHREKEIEVMTSALARIFRYSIKGEDYVELNQEIDILKAYISIQQNRFMDRFDVTYAIEEHLMDMSIIKMILQPIIENAIVHGIEPMEGKCSIKIKIIEEDAIKIMVIDDGIGIPTDQLQHLQKQLHTDEQSPWQTEHLGLLNVHRRLRHAYGHSSGIKISSEEGSGTNVCLVIASDQV